MIEWSLDALRASESVRSIVVAVPSGYDHGLAGEDLTVVDGGAVRAESVANALASVQAELVAIHDAARPLLTSGLTEELVAALDADAEAAGAIAAVPVTDTIKSVAPNRAFGLQDNQKAQLGVERTLDRSQLWAAQTPQVFRTEALRAALAVGPEVRDAATDEATLVEAAGGKVLLHPVLTPNLKVTTPHDLRVAALLLRERGGSVPD